MKKAKRSYLHVDAGTDLINCSHYRSGLAGIIGYRRHKCQLLFLNAKSNPFQVHAIGPERLHLIPLY